MKKLLSILMAVLAGATLIVVQTPRTAEASAYGCTSGNPFYGPAHYCVNLRGGGRFVDWVDGNFGGAGMICDYRITAEFFKTNWSWYRTYNSSTTYGCASGGSKRINIYATMPFDGYMCSTLHYRSPQFGWRKMSVCHRIYR